MKKLTFALLGLALAACAVSRNGGIQPTPAPTGATTATLADTPLRTSAEVLPTSTRAPTLERIPSFAIDDLYMIDAQHGWAGGYFPDFDHFHYFHTDDGGRTWALVSPLGDSTSCGNIANFFLDAQIAWLFLCRDHSLQVLRTLDGGRTWAVMDEAFEHPTGAIYPTFISELEGWVMFYWYGAGGGHANFFRTHDGGATWSQVEIASPPDSAITPHGPGEVTVCNICGDGIYYDPRRSLTPMMIVNGGGMDLEDFCVCFQTTEWGTTWQDTSLPLPRPDSEHYMQYARGQLVFFGRSRNEGILPVRVKTYDENGMLLSTLQVFGVTYNGGLDWKLVGTGAGDGSQLDDFQFFSLQQAVARCGDNLCVTHNGTATWSVIHPNVDILNPNTSIRFVDPNIGWALIRDQDYRFKSLYGTTDGGQTWTELQPLVVNQSGR